MILAAAMLTFAGALSLGEHVVPLSEKKKGLHCRQTVAFRYFSQPGILGMQMPSRRVSLEMQRTQEPDWYSMQ